MAEKILVRGVNWLGDAVMTTPALQRLREARPDAHITLHTHEKLADLWAGHPSLNAALTFNESDSVFSVADRLRAQQFDLAVVFPNSPRSAIETFLARIPARIGYARNGRNFFLTRAIPPRPAAMRMHKRSVAEVKQRVAQNLPRETYPAAAHHVHDYLHLVAALGADSSPVPPLLHISSEEVASVRTRLGLKPGDLLVGLNPGAEYGPAKRWPAERFAEAAVELHRQTRCSLVLLGGRGDVELTRGIGDAIAAHVGEERIANLAGQTTLRELCAALKACAVLITNDTGPMHLAAALGTRVVVPFGSTAPELTGPAFTADSPHETIMGAASCAPCFRRECPIDFRCLNSVTTAQIVRAALKFLQGRL